MNKQVNSQQSGFTLIELIMVIVILGALAVTVLPKYVDLQSKANQAALDGVSGAVTAGAATNYAACITGASGCTNAASKGSALNCQDVGTMVSGGASGIPATGYTVGPATTAFPGTKGATVACTVTQTASTLTETVKVLDPG